MLNFIPSKLKYPHQAKGRDLRLDFLRGLIMLVVITVHMEYYSIFSMFAWGRVGLVSSAEGFVALSGIVLGIVYKKRILREGFKQSAIKLWKRSFQLYRVNLFMILSIALLGTIPMVDIFEVTHWIPISNPEHAIELYPPKDTPWFKIVQQTLLLRIGPHQFQVIGLYVGLLAIAPGILYCLYRQKVLWLIIVSWGLFWINQSLQLRITGARFEWAFPSLTWQLLFINGMATGFYHDKVLGYILERRNKLLVIVAGLISLGFLFIASNHPNPVFWPYPPLTFINPSSFHTMYMAWFQKSTLGFGRVINNISLFIVFYYALSRYWTIFDKTLGWLLIPLGQASLYVFFLHVYFIILFSNTSLPEYNDFFINTAIHASTILLIWFMVKCQFLFNVIPR